MSRFVKPSRERMTTIAEDGSRNFLHPADVQGRFTLWRRMVAGVILTLFAALPFIPINGHPALLFDIIEKRFHLFGFTLAPQDLWIFFFLITGLGFSLFFITALLGRVWCGWTCPQTLFLEHVYRRIERWIEGDSAKQRRLDNAAWSNEKIIKRGGKHLIFVIVSILIAHWILAYFVSLPRVYSYLTGAPTAHWSAFLFILVASAILYFNFAWFREQLCLVICPYGRLQSALIDDHSMVIGYDEKRGEPRGRKAGVSGDCIDCFRCVQVCPTGIDIRQGLQIECIGCANCVDACDEVMDKQGSPRGLVRYDSLSGLNGEKTRWLRPRIWLYLLLMMGGMTVCGVAISKVEPITATAIRMRGSPYYVKEGTVRNQLEFRLINKQGIPVAVSLDVDTGDTPAQLSGWKKEFVLPPGSEEVFPLVLTVDLKEYTGPFETTLRFSSDNPSFEVERKIDFLGPDPRLIPTNSPNTPPTP